MSLAQTLLHANRQLWLLVPPLSLSAACSVGEGQGFVRSDRVRARACWDGPLDLKPNFFAASPFLDTINIRIQRGEEGIGMADGVSLLVHDADWTRSQLGRELALGLPSGVEPLGVPEAQGEAQPAASMSLYLNGSCRNEGVTLYAVGGFVKFEELFSGDANEPRADRRITEGSFEAQMADLSPPAAGDTPEPAAALESTVSGWFRFVFHRGTPAQPFP